MDNFQELASVLLGEPYSVASTLLWPLAAISYMLCWPIAEYLWWHECKRFVHEHNAMPHQGYAGAQDIAETRRFWNWLLSETGDARGDVRQRVGKMLRAWLEKKPSKARVTNFVAWSMFNTLELDEAQHADAYSIASRLEVALGEPLAPCRRQSSSSSCAETMMYTLEELSPSHRPLLMYLAIHTAQLLLGLLLRALGFRLHSIDGLRYWARPSSSAAAGVVPVVFMHGLLGLLPYVLTLLQLTRHQRGAVLLPICEDSSLFAWSILVDNADSRSSRAQRRLGAIRAMVAAHCGTAASPRASFFAHSFGTATLAALVKTDPDLVRGAVFSDPICFELHSGHVLRNFLYPQRCPSGVYRFVQRHVVSSEYTVQACLRRSFWWSQAWLLPDDLCCESLVVLSGNDTVADADEVGDAIAAWQRGRWVPSVPSVEVELKPRWYHGFMMVMPAAQLEIVRAAARMAETAGRDLASSRKSRETALDVGALPGECCDSDCAVGATPSTRDLLPAAGNESPAGWATICRAAGAGAL